MASSEEQAHIQKMVQESVHSGRFMPFLGAGVSSIRPKDPEDVPWKTVSDRISQLLHYLEEQKENEACKYLQSQRKAHEIGLDVKSKIAYPLDLNDPIVSLQLALVRTSSRLVEIFGKKMQSERTCVADLTDYRVDLSDEDRKNLLGPLLDVDDAAKKMSESIGSQGKASEKHNFVLEADSIYENLIELTCRKFHDICGESPDEFQDRIHAHPGICRFVKNDEIERFLRLDELAWLEDLLWYTLRFNVPAYPTTTELSFYLSLSAKKVLRRGELPEVAELQATHQQLRYISEWLGYCENNVDSRRTLHVGLAAAIQYEYQLFKAGQEGFTPILFTTNFDRTIERALGSLNIGEHFYHVVFPMSGYVRKLSSSDVIWVFRTYRIASSEEKSKSIDLFDCAEWTYPRFKENIKGPVIIKLHGSPLEKIDEKDLVDINRGRDEDIGFSKLVHYLILSESSYLLALVGTPKYPIWMQKVLTELGRHLWFLGYSISDWNVRMRLFQYSHSQSETSKAISDYSSSSSKKIAYDRHFDVMRLGILDTLEILRFPGELRDFVDFLMDMNEIKELVSGSRR